MHPHFSSSTSGFTLIELLVVIAIIGVLSAIAVPNYKEFRIRAYHASAQSMFRNARTAYEASDVHVDYADTTALVVMANKSASFTGNGELLLPGITADKNMYIYIYHNPTCATGTACTQGYLTVRHCQSPYRLLWYRLGTGVEQTTYKIVDNVGC